ncbi:unnamed protein product [Phytophthora lilii]|uniref:Unnamed protein product n=1 Tax=Phytophthora lilii TaxID=2077276 RepID=A0A9W7D9W0_9STRA|nr:unnamed protein product [Phytophthora lilii]
MRSLFKPILSIFSLALVLQAASGLEYTDNGIAIVGTTEPLNVDVKAGASREDLISYEFASYIAVHFAGFNLPDGDSVVISSPDDKNTSVSHTYTGRGRDQRGTFIASFIPGNSVTVTYNSVGAATADQGYRITGFSRGYPTMKEESICGDGDQSLPAKCYAPGSNLSEGLPLAYKKAQAVARLLINGTYLCTGWLGGSEGHIFTNQHCFEEEEWALTTDFEFGAESSSCSDECEEQLGCAGKLVATTSTFIADSNDIDYSVVKLPDCVDLRPYGYLQLRGSGPEVNESIYVPQHPDGYAKRIVSTVDGGDDTSIRSVGEDGSCGTNQVQHDADTQGGSSGSPLIATNDNLVVAIHHCGGCMNTAIDVRTVLTDLASKNITIANLIASDDVGQSGPPLYAQTSCTAQTFKNSSHAAQNKTIPCGKSSMAKHGSNKTTSKTTTLTTTASNSTTTTLTGKKTTRSSLQTSVPIGISNSSDAAAKNVSSSSSTSSVSRNTTSSTVTTTSFTNSTATSVTKTSAVSKTTGALTSASLVTSSKASKTTSAPSTAAVASIPTDSAVTSSSSLSSASTSSGSSTKVSRSLLSTVKTSSAIELKTSTPSPTPAATASTVSISTIVAKLLAAVIGNASTPSTPRPTPASTSVIPNPTVIATPKPTTPSPTPAASSPTSSSGGSEDVEQD